MTGWNHEKLEEGECGMKRNLGIKIFDVQNPREIREDPAVPLY
jgi:hypothetical protein